MYTDWKKLLSIITPPLSVMVPGNQTSNVCALTYGQVGAKFPPPFVLTIRLAGLVGLIYHALPNNALPTNGPVWPPMPSDDKYVPITLPIFTAHGISVLCVATPSAPDVPVHAAMVDGQRYGA
jgi:hypothetical protein